MATKINKEVEYTESEMRLTQRLVVMLGDAERTIEALGQFDWETGELYDDVHAGFRRALAYRSEAEAGFRSQPPAPGGEERDDE